MTMKIVIRLKKGGYMKLIEREPVGIIFRTFAQNESQVPERIAMVKTAIDKALALSIEGMNVFKFVDILIPVDKRYPSSDCGLTASLIREAYSSQKRVRVHELMGDLFCSLLNDGILIQFESKVRYSMIVSPDAHEYLTEENVRRMFSCIEEKGSLAVGLAINELRESILDGFIANTIALWHNKSLMSVGGFNLISAETENDKRTHYLEGSDQDGKIVFYPIKGVEEVIPLAYMVKKYGRCISAVEPLGVGHYEVIADEDLQKRHYAKMATKRDRQDELLSLVGFHSSIIKNGLVL